MTIGTIITVDVETETMNVQDLVKLVEDGSEVVLVRGAPGCPCSHS